MNKAAPDTATGLTSDEARRRLAASGTNAVQDVVENPIHRALKKLWAPVPWMLEAAILAKGSGAMVRASGAFSMRRQEGSGSRLGQTRAIIGI
jgi:Cation transporter/ATPase, N-terminus